MLHLFRPIQCELLSTFFFPRACLLLAGLVYDFSTMSFGSFLCLFSLKPKLYICIFNAFNSLLLPYLFSAIIRRLMPIWLGFCSSPAAFSSIFVLPSMLSFLLEFSFNSHKTWLIFFSKSHLMSSSPWSIHRNKSSTADVLQTVPSPLINTASLFPSSAHSHLLSFVLYFGVLQGRNYLFALYSYTI